MQKVRSASKVKLKIIWPGKTQNINILNLQSYYLNKIIQMDKCEIIETKTAKGISEKFPDKIKAIEASGLEKHLKDNYIICLLDKGKEMNSDQFAIFLQKTALNFPHGITFMVGGFLGLADSLLKKADLALSLSRMTFSHELTRIVLLEQIYRSLSLIKGRHYAK